MRKNLKTLWGLFERLLAMLAIVAGVWGFSHQEFLLSVTQGRAGFAVSTSASALLVREAGLVRYQPVGASFWHDLFGTAQTMKGGDSVLTGPDGSALLTFHDGTSVHLSPDSLLVVKLEEAVPSRGLAQAVWSVLAPEPRKVKLDLKRGTAQVRVKDMAHAPVDLASVGAPVSAHEPVVISLQAGTAPILHRASQAEEQNFEREAVAVRDLTVETEDLLVEEPVVARSMLASAPPLLQEKAKEPAPILAEPAKVAEQIPEVPAVILPPTPTDRKKRLASGTQKAPVIEPPKKSSEELAQEPTTRKVSSYSVAELPNPVPFRLRIGGGISSLNVTQGASTVSPVNYIHTGQSLTAAASYNAEGDVGGELRFDHTSGTAAASQATAVASYQETKFSADVIKRLATSPTASLALRAGASYLSSPYFVTDRFQLQTLSSRTFSVGLGLGGNWKPSRSWQIDALVKGQVPVAQASDEDRLHQSNQRNLEALFAVTYVTSSHFRFGVQFSAAQQSYDYTLQQLDNSVDSSHSQIRTYGTNAVLGLDF